MPFNNSLDLLCVLTSNTCSVRTLYLLPNESVRNLNVIRMLNILLLVWSFGCRAGKFYHCAQLLRYTQATDMDIRVHLHMYE